MSLWDVCFPHEVLGLPKAESVAEVRSFLGHVNFCARFIPDLATVSEPLKRLSSKDVPYQWGKEKDKAFNELKKRLANTETLGYFDLDAVTRLITDASPVGPGAVERRYSQTEREALGIV